MNKTTKEICKADNRLQRKLLDGTISRAEFDYRKKTIHKNYIIATSEDKMLKELLKKHGGC